MPEKVSIFNKVEGSSQMCLIASVLITENIQENTCNPVHNILEFFKVLVQVPFTTSEEYNLPPK